MKNFIIVALLFMLVSLPATTQTTTRNGAALPATCTANVDWFYKTSPPYGIQRCTSTNVWTSDAVSSLPTGIIVLALSGTCPVGTAEVSALNGFMLRGTVAANADVNTSGGSDIITPTGTVSAPTFTGSAATSTAVTAGTPSGTISTPTFTGNAVVAASTNTGTKLVTGNTSTGVSPVTTATGTVSAPTFTGSALSTHTHSVTATGTNSAPVFTGASFDSRPSFKRVIFCMVS